MKKESFLKEALGSIKTTGTIRPSSKHLIKKIIKDVDFGSARVILEFGAGDGCITREIADQMSPDARLLSFEINDAFFQHCVDDFADDDRVEMLRSSAFEFEQDLARRGIQDIDYVISSLPLALFKEEQIKQLLSDVSRCLSPSGRFIQYQYSLGNYKHIRSAFDSVDVVFTLRNLPPAFVYSCTK